MESEDLVTVEEKCNVSVESWMPLTLPFFALKMNLSNRRDSARSFLLYASGPPQAGGLLLQLQIAGMRQFWQQASLQRGEERRFRLLFLLASYLVLPRAHLCAVC